MAKILYTWEIGGGMGHIGAMLPLALELRARKHEVSFALKDLAHAETMLGKHAFAVWQGPVSQHVPSHLANPASYAEILLAFGFINAPTLLGLCRAWQNLFAAVQPDLVIADHSPVALLTARALGIKRAAYGNGFCIPPRVSPMPSLRTWQPADTRRLASSERLALQTANHAIKALAISAESAASPVQPLNALFDLFDNAENFLKTWRELDQYASRSQTPPAADAPPTRYWGASANLDHGADIDWPNRIHQHGDQPLRRVFVYLTPGTRDFEKVMAALSALCVSPATGVVAIICAPGMPPQMLEKYQSATCLIRAAPIKLAPLLEDCTLAINNANSGTTAAMLLSGVPLLMLPAHLEQYLTAERVVALGAGVLVHPEHAPPDYPQLIHRLLNDAAFTQQAKAFAARYAEFTQARQITAMADRIEEILADGKASVTNSIYH